MHAILYDQKTGTALVFIQFNKNMPQRRMNICNKWRQRWELANVFISKWSTTWLTKICWCRQNLNQYIIFAALFLLQSCDFKTDWNRVSTSNPRQKGLVYCRHYIQFHRKVLNFWLKCRWNVFPPPFVSVVTMPVLVQIMAWSRTDRESLFEPKVGLHTYADMYHSALMS